MDDLPDELDFHIPQATSLTDPVPLHLDDERRLYRQLICWCLIQRYWYYVVAQPKVDDATYDAIENHIARMEKELPILPNNKHSPTKRPGSTRREDYPPFVRWAVEQKE